MATPVQLMEQMMALTQRMSVLEAENARLRAANGEGVAAIPALVEAVTRMTGRGFGSQGALVDTRGIGKPSVFDGSENKYREWAAKFESFVVSVFGEPFRRVLEWAAEHDAPVGATDWTAAFGPDTIDPDDKIAELDDKVYQLHTALQQLTTGEPFDISRNVGKGNGLECWRKLSRRYDPATGGRKRNLLRQILTPGRCLLEDLGQALERW